MSEFIPYGKQNINQDDINSVIEVLRSDFITQGETVPKFEESIASHCDVKYAVAANSATSSLHIACLALGVGVGDTVWTSPNSFVASSNCALYCGAKVDFVDIDSNTFNMSVDFLEEKLIKAAKENCLPKVVIPVHIAGQSCEMDRIFDLSKKYNFSIIEDASHAIGAKYKGRPVGACDYSDITVFSFHPVKIITTAEGGMATTNNKDLFDKMNRLRSHGITRDREIMAKDDGPWYYEQLDLGFNYRMPDILAALGLSQMSRLSEFVEKRNQIANIYQDKLSHLPIKLPQMIRDAYSSYHLFILQIENRDEVFKKLRDENIGVNLHYIPIHLQPFYKRLGFQIGDFPNAEAYYSKAISIPVYPDLDYNSQMRVISNLEGCLH